MSTGFGKSTDAPLTRYRKTTVTFDDALQAVWQPPVQIDRPAEACGQTKDSKKVDVHYVNKIGWQVRAHQADYGKVHESAVAQAGTLSAASGAILKASGFTESDYQRRSGLTGVTYNPDVPTTGRPGLQKNVPAGTDWDDASFNLSADQTAFPGPTYSDAACEMDRVVVTTDPHLPTEQVHFWFEMPASSIAGYGSLVQFYFNGPAGSDAELKGKGNYCLRLRGDGLAKLFEYGTDPDDDTSFLWAERFAFVYEPSNHLSAFKTYHVTVVSDSVQTPSGAYKGSKIVFSTLGIANRSIVPALADAAASAIKVGSKVPGSELPVYYPPKVTDEATELIAARVDVRRDLRAVFHVMKSTFPETGQLTDGVFSLDFFPTDDTSFTFEWYSATDDLAGATIDAKLFDAETGVELPGSLNFTDQYGGSKTYTPTDRQRYYYVQVDFATAGFFTPTFFGWRLFRDPVVGIWDSTGHTTTVDDSRGSPPSLPKAQVSSVSVKGADGDPSDAGAVVVIEDYTELCPFLRGRDGVPVKVETTYDSGGTDKSVLFRGYTQGASGVPRKGTGKTPDTSKYPSPYWTKYSVPCVGEWRKLSDALAPRRFTWFDRAMNEPWLVSDFCSTLLRAAGYPDSMIDVPSSPLKMWPQGQTQNLLEPSDPIAPVLVRTVQEYFGGWLVFDENAGTDGMWRVLEQKLAPYRILARFMSGHPSDGGSTATVPHVDGAYGTATIDGEAVPVTFMRRGTFASWVERPEGNCVTVYGGALSEDAAKLGQNAGSMLTQTLVNVRSYNALNLAEAHVNYPAPSTDGGLSDYLGYYAPIRVFDPSLSTQEAVDWVCRRVYQYACFARKYVTFDAPLLLVTDPDDTEQTNPRPLRFYDAVEMWNPATQDFDTYLVVSCDPQWGKDGFQWAHYRLMTTTNIDEFTSPPPSKTSYDFLSTYVAKSVMGLDTRVSKPGQKQFKMSGLNDWVNLPEPTSPTIQDLDPDSATFGDLSPSLDFAALS